MHAQARRVDTDGTLGTGKDGSGTSQKCEVLGGLDLNKSDFLNRILNWLRRRCGISVMAQSRLTARQPV